MKNRLLQIPIFFVLFLLVITGCEKIDPEPEYNIVSSGKQILSFNIVTPAVSGVIDTINKTITITVPGGTDVTDLETNITLAEDYTISPASGEQVNLTNPVVYTVASPESQTVSWTVMISFSAYLITDDISENTTWLASEEYLVQGDVTVVDNAVLTIEPGTVIQFANGASLSVGYSSGAQLVANGTVDNPIIFTSAADAPTAGAWEGLFFYNNTLSNTVLNFCEINYAGSNEAYGALNVLNCDITVTNSEIDESGSYGIFSTYDNNKGGFVAFNNNSISNTADYSIVIDAQKLSTIGTGNTFTNTKEVSITGDYESTTPQIWKKLEVDYVIEYDIDIDGDLTIEAGSVFKCAAGVQIHIGYYANTTFIADGASAETPVVFTSVASAPTAGAWNGIRFWGYTLNNTKMNFCTIDYAGADDYYGAVYLNDCSVIFTNNTLSNSAGKGLVLDPESGFTSFHDNTINTCADHLISISTEYLPDLGVPNTLTAAVGKGILVEGSVIYNNPVVWKKQSVDFYISGGENDIDGVVTIEAGTTFRFITDAYFWFGYYENTKITAVGSSTDKITFTSASASPVEGSWKGFVFDAYVQSNSSLDYCDFFYTGLEEVPALYTYTTFNVSNTTINEYGSDYPAVYGADTTPPTGSGNNFTWHEDL